MISLLIVLAQVLSILSVDTISTEHMKQDTIRAEVCTVQYNSGEVEFIDNMGYIWFVDNTDLRIKPDGGKTVTVCYLVNDENDIFDDEIVTAYCDGVEIFGG